MPDRPHESSHAAEHTVHTAEGPPLRVAVVGAGFSGLLTAIQLLKSPRTRVTLVERSTSFATGAAYATGNPDHLLNVRLGNMSAFPDQPDHLTEWLSTHSQWTVRDGFITRGVYGEYLRSLLAAALADEGAGPRLSLVRGEAVDLMSEGDAWRLRLDDDRSVDADAVILALGNIEPLTPAGMSPELLGTWRYVGDPWRAADSLPPAARRILMIGSGLTMVDAALSLRGPGRKLTSISRRGLLPRHHGVVAARPTPEVYEGDPVAVMRQVRRLSRTRDWREVMDEVRLSARELWKGWSPRQRASILRHLRPHWEVHRHRLSPIVAQRVHEMIASGELSVAAGRVVNLSLKADGVSLTWRPRGARRTAVRRFDAVVNCTGPLGDINQSRSPLIRSLLARNLIRPDPHGLGVHVDDRHRLLSSQEEGAASLYALGPLTRGTFWEATSVPDLRIQAVRVAVQVLAKSGPQGAG